MKSCNSIVRLVCQKFQRQVLLPAELFRVGDLFVPCGIWFVMEVILAWEKRIKKYGPRPSGRANI